MKYRIYWRDYCTDIEGYTGTIVDRCTFSHPIDIAYALIHGFKQMDLKNGTNCDYWLVPA
jgi:hypothetical protein